MLDEILYEVMKLKWLAIVSVCLIIILSILFWIFSRKFNFDKKSVNIFSSLFKLSKNQIICVGLIVGRLLFVLTSVVFCKDINIGHLILFAIFTFLIFVFGRDLRTLITSLLNYAGIFFLIFIESTLVNYYFDIENMYVILIMAVLVGFFVFLDSLLTSINSYNAIVKKEVAHEEA